MLGMVLCFLLESTELKAQAPVNDSCSNAQEISLGTGGFALGTFQSDSIAIDSATVQVGEYFYTSLVTSGNDKKSIWFKFYLPARRGVDIELKQNANAIATKDCGFTTYLADQCLPNSTAATAAKLTSLNQFGSSFHPCMDPGWYMVQVSAKSRAAGKIYLQIKTSYPYEYPAIVNAEYDDQDSAYDFGDQVVGKVGSTSGYVDFELGCYTISDSTEYYADLGQNYLEYNQSAWFVFESNKDHDNTQLIFSPRNNCSQTDTMAFRLYKGDCRNGGSLQLLDSSFNDWTSNYVCYNACGEYVKDFQCLFDSGEVYSVQLLFHKDQDNTMRFHILDQTSQYDSGYSQPNLSYAKDLDTLSGSRTINTGFSCSSYISANTCGNANSQPIRLGSFDYNLANWFTFELDEQSRLGIQFTYGNNGNYKRYTELAFRLFKDTITSSCGGVDTNNVVLTGTNQSVYNIDCLEPGRYAIQVLGADSVRDYSNWSCQGAMHLGGDYRLYLTQSRLPSSNRFALTNVGEADTINGFNPLPYRTSVNGKVDTISCNDAVRPLEVCDTAYRKAMYRVFEIGDANNDGKADSGMLFVSYLQNVYRGYPYYDYNAHHRLYKGDALSLRSSQSVSGYPDTLLGLDAVGICYPQSATSFSACLEPGKYTLVSYFDSIGISRTEQPRFEFYTDSTKFNTYATAEFVDSIMSYGTYYGIPDTLSCSTNPDTIDGVYCGRRNTYHVFYLDTLSVTNINIGYGNYYYGARRFSLFKGDIRNGKSGLSLHQDGVNWSCTGYSVTTTDCRPLPAGWYTVVISQDDDISYDTSNNTTASDFRRVHTYTNAVTITTRASNVTPPKYYRPSLAAYVDSLVNNGNALDYDTNYTSITGMPLNLARYNFPREVLECDLDTPMNHHPKNTLCDTNATDIVYYTFNLKRDAYVKIWGRVSGGAWDVKLYDFDVRVDSAKLATATPVQDCNYQANFVEFCNLLAGTYSVVYYCKRTSGQSASVEPVMHIDSVFTSRFDHAQNAYDFGRIPGDSSFYDGKIGDTHPWNSSLPASHDVITCKTGAQTSDPTTSACYGYVNPLVYSGDTNVSMYPYDSVYQYYPDGTRYNPWAYGGVRRNIWYSYVVEGRGNVTVNLKGLNSNLINSTGKSVRFSIFESDEDGNLSLAILKSTGKLDSTVDDGLTYINEDYPYCYYTSDQTVTYAISSCEKVKARRYYVLVETTNYYNAEIYPNVNQNVWLEVLYDSLYIPDTRFDYYSTANDVDSIYNYASYTSGNLYKGEKTYFAGSTLDSTDYNRTYYYSSCSDPTIAGTVWYKFNVDSTGYLYYNYLYSQLSGSNITESISYDANTIRVYRSTIDGDSLAGLELVPRISTSGTYYSLMQGYSNYICVQPGTYYIQINKCNRHECSDYVYPQLVFDFHTGDFCETAIPLQIDSLQQVAGRALVNCHTIGTDFGEDGSNMGCLYGPGGYKSSWFVVDYTDTTKVDLEFKLAEYTDAKASEIRYRTYYGNCKSLTPAPCNNNALTSFVLDCIRKGTYYVQIVTPENALGELEMSVEAKENTDTTCNPVDIFQPNAAFYYNTGCPENVVEFVNTSSRGDSIRYFWDFGYYGWTDTVLNPVVAYPALNEEKSYPVKLIVEQITRGSKDSIEINVVVPFSPYVNILNNDTVLCPGDSVELTGEISHWKGVWSTGDTADKITVSRSGMYYFKMLDKDQLLRNASFERDPTSNGWTAASGTWTRTSSYNPRDSTYVTYGSHSSSSSTGIVELYQDVDVSIDSIEIDSGIAKTSLTGYLRGHNSYEDEAQLILEYYDKAGSLLAIYQSGFLSVRDNWQYLEHSRTTPKNTRWVRVKLQTNKVNTNTTTSYSFFDKLVLKMRSACDYRDSVYVRVSQFPEVSLPADTFFCAGDSLLIGPTISYENPYVIQDSMKGGFTGSLKNDATHTSLNDYVVLTPASVNSANGQIEWEDSSLSLTDSFIISFDYYSSGNQDYALWFYLFNQNTPTNEDFYGGGYSVALDRDNSNSIQIEWNNSRRSTHYTGINLDDGEWHNVEIRYSNQSFEIYIDGILHHSFVDLTNRTQAGYKFGLGARSYNYNEYRVRNFHISKDNDAFIVVPVVAETSYTYQWNDAVSDSARWVKSSGTLSISVVDEYGCESNLDTISVEARRQYDSLFTSVEDVCSELDTFRVTKPVQTGYFYGNSAIDSTGLVTVDSAAYGANVIYFSVVDSFGCTLRDTGAFVVDSVPQIVIDSVGPVCENDTAVQLTVNHVGGYFYGGNYVDSSGVFDPSKTTQAINKVYYTTIGSDCRGVDSIDIEIDTVPDASLVAAGPFCVNTGSQQIQVQNDTTGKFTAFAYIDTIGVFSPMLAGVGSHPVIYSVANTSGCLSSDTIQITVDSLPDASLNPTGPFCENSGIQSITPTINTGGQFQKNTYIDSLGNFNPELAGSGNHLVYYTFTDANGCSNNDSTFVQVDSLPDVSFTSDQPYCENDALDTLVANFNVGGKFYGGGYIDSIGQFDPSQVGKGSYQVFYTFTDGNQCNSIDSAVLTVDSVTTINLSSTSPYCVNDTVQTLVANPNLGGNFSGGSFVDTAGNFNPTSAGFGNHMVYFQQTNGLGCSSYDSIQVYVDSLPNAAIQSVTPLCANDDSVQLAGVESGGYFIGGSFVDSTGWFKPQLSGAGNFKVYYTLTNVTGCVKMDSVEVMVDTIPDASIQSAGPYCENEGIQNLNAQVNTGGRFTPTSYLDTSGVFDPSVALNGSYTVYYSFTDGNGCMNLDSTVVVVDTIPDASLTPAGPFCENEGDQQLSASINSGGRYTPTSYVDTSGVFKPHVALAGSHWVYYSFTDGNGCNALDSARIQVDTIPDASIQAAGPFCENGGIQNLTPSVNSGGQFTKTTYLDSLGAFDPSLASTGQHTVFYQFTDGNGCSNEDSTVVQVDSIPDASITQAGPFCVNSPEFTLAATFNGGGRFAPTAYVDTIGRFNPTIAMAGKHTVYYSFTDGNGCSNTDSTVVQIDTLPDASIQPHGRLCPNGAVLRLTPTISGGTFSGGMFIDSIGDFDPTVSGEGAFKVYYTRDDGAGCSNLDSTTVYVDSLPEASIQSAGPFCLNDGIQVIQPTVSGGNFTVETYITQSGSFSPADAGVGTTTLYYTLTDGNSCTNMDSVDIVVDSIPDASLTAAGPFCENEGVQTVVPAINVGGRFTPTSFIDTAGNFDPAIAQSGNHWVYYTFTDGNGCAGFDSTQLMVDTIPNAAITPAGPYCENAGVQQLTGLYNSGGSFTSTAYLTTSGSFDPSVALTGTHKVYYSLTDGNGCSNIDSTQIQVDTLPDASIVPAGPLCENDNVYRMNPQVNGPGTFTVTSYLNAVGHFDPGAAGSGSHKVKYSFTDGNSCTNVDSIYVVVNGIPDASITPAGPFCENDGIQTLTPTTNSGGVFSGTGVDASGNFDPATAQAGTHQISYDYTDGNNCKETGTIQVQVFGLPDAGLSLLGPLCRNDNAIQVSANTPGGSFTGGVYVDGTGLFTPKLAQVGQNKVVHSVTNAQGCTTLDSIDVEIRDIPSNTLTANPINGCETLIVDFATQPEDSIRWLIDQTEVVNQTAVTDSFSAGVYNVVLEVFNTQGCGILIDTTVESYANPEANFDYSPDPVFLSNPDVYFSDLSLGNVVAWDWNFGDLGTSNDQHPNHNYTEGGEYQITLFIRDNNGCVDSTSQTLVVLDELMVFIPNAIRPDGDGINDVFRITGTGYTQVAIQIFNRWGERIYESDNFTQWDATYLGQPVQMGAYVYILTFTDNRGVKNRQSGEVHVIR